MYSLHIPQAVLEASVLHNVTLEKLERIVRELRCSNILTAVSCHKSNAPGGRDLTRIMGVKFMSILRISIGSVEH